MIGEQELSRRINMQSPSRVILLRDTWVKKFQVRLIQPTLIDLGIFFKYDVEPLQLTIVHTHTSLYRFLIRLLALVGGVIICTEWAYKGFDALTQRMENGRGRGNSDAGLLNGIIEKGD
jgi:Endoplasmic reticulum vesicle transporter